MKGRPHFVRKGGRGLGLLCLTLRVSGLAEPGSQYLDGSQSLQAPEATLSTAGGPERTRGGGRSTNRRCTLAQIGERGESMMTFNLGAAARLPACKRVLLLQVVP